MNASVYLAYRPEDGEAHAWIMAEALEKAGFSVFFDPDRRGTAAAEAALDGCTDVVLLLTAQALGSAIYEPDDVLHRELSAALAGKRHILGLALTGFEGFPEVLPADLAQLPGIPMLCGKDNFYDAMTELLVSGRYLAAAPEPLPTYEQWSHFLSETSGAGMFQSGADLLTACQLDIFAQNPGCDRTLALFSSHGTRLEMTLHKMHPDSADELLEFQQRVVSRIPDVDETNLFQSLSREEFEYDLRRDLCIGVYRDGVLGALLVLLPNPSPEQNILLDLAEYCGVDPREILVVDVVLVDETLRGFGLQKLFFLLADQISRKSGIRYECCTISPLNFHSQRNAIRAGYRLVGNFRKYRSTRNFFVRELVP